MDRTKRISVHALKNRFLAPGLFCKDQKPPQSPPQKAPLVKLAVKEVKPPVCPHDVQLTSEEYEANCYAFGCLKMKDRPVSFETVLLRSSACLQCSPQCEHGQPMSQEEVVEAIKSGKRFSSACAACTHSENGEDWERILKYYGLGPGRGMSPAKHVIPMPDGSTHFLGQQKNFQTGWDIERKDAASNVSRDDMPARSRKPEGHGSDDPPETESDEELGYESRQIKEEFERPDPEYEED